MAFDFPATPVTNQTITMPDGTVRRWDGTKWVAGQTPQSPTCTYGDTPPASPAPGVLWFDTVSCQMFLWYNDGNSSQWVPTVAIPASVGEAPVDSNIYGRINGGWTNLLAAQQIQANVGRNLIHNSMFNVAQRGAGPFTTAPANTVDRWLMTFSLDTLSISQSVISDAGRGIIGDEAVAFVLSSTFTGNAGAGAFSLLEQRIEGVRRLAGKTITISFWSNATATLNLGVSLYQMFGTGGSPSTTVTINGQRVTLTGGWTRYSVTFNIPSIIGMTLGTVGDYTGLRFWYSAGSTNAAQSGNVGVQAGTINLWGVQLEIGTKATQLEKIEYADDLRHCQRFFQAGIISVVGSAAAGGSFNAQISFPVTMRAQPTVTLSGLSYSNASGASIYSSGSGNFVARVGTVAAGDGAMGGAYTATADL
jgi:hypothetical protein